MRHGSAGVPWQVAEWVDVSVVNAGDGWHEHPTQALLDCYTIRQEFGRQGLGRSLDGLHVGIVGDIKHSRVARSNVLALTALGAQVTLVAPATLLPPSLVGWPVDWTTDLDDVVPKLDVCYLLRMQLERQEQALVPSLREYAAGYGLNPERAARLPGHALVMHPGPMNRGVEIAARGGGAAEVGRHQAGGQRGGGAHGGPVPPAGFRGGTVSGVLIRGRRGRGRHRAALGRRAGR